MEDVIREGRVSVNGTVATIGDRVGQGDEIPSRWTFATLYRRNEKRRRILMYYKPEGEICSAHDPEGRPRCLSACHPKS